MYKLLMFSLFFSTLSVAQTIPPASNQQNSVVNEQEKEEQLQIDVMTSKDKSAQTIIFTSYVQQIQAELDVFSFSTSRKSPTVLEHQEMQAQLEILKAINAQSFEYNLLNYQVGNYDFTRLENLRAAERLQPNNASVLKELSAHSYIMNDEVALKKYLGKLSTQQIFSKDLQLYAENTLQSLPKNAVLITHGEKDTYPLLIQQKIKNSRADVEIISLDHLQSEEYRKRLKKSGFILPKSDFIDTRYFGEFMQLNKSKNIVVAASVPRTYLTKGGSNMKTVGLGITYSSLASYYDALNLQLYEKSMKVAIEQHVNQAKEKQLLGNYLPFLFSVRNECISKNDANKTADIERLILKIARLSNKEQQVKSLLSK